MGDTDKILIIGFLSILFLVLVWFICDIDSKIPFTDTWNCRKYWEVHTNVTPGQGERYDVTNDICTLEYLGGYGYGDAEVRMEKVNEFVNVLEPEKEKKK